ncbi:MAG: hypothetical protein P4L65_06805 [Legionella sp.]|nr:hypothetical protein [Legionella sp.]
MKTFLLFITCMCTSYAAPTLKNILHPKKLNQHTPNKTAIESYTDFSGIWFSPKCMGSQLSLYIENSDESIIINGEENQIGTINTKSTAGQQNSLFSDTSSEVTFIEWNADQSQLILKFIDIQKAFNSPENPEPMIDPAVFYSMNSVTLALDKEQLLLKFRTAEYKDFQRIDSSQPTCIFTKSEEEIHA